MIILATLTDEMVEGQRKAAGKQIRKITAVCLDNYNIVLAEGADPTKLSGKKFACKLTHLAKSIETYGCDVENARIQMIDFFKRYTGKPVDSEMTWAEMDEQFHLSKRSNDSSGKLAAYNELKEKGWKDEKATVAA
jgi:hypothetical protein